MSVSDKPLLWLRGEVKTPPFSQAARLEAGFLLRQLQQGAMLGMPHACSMPTIGPACHELRIKDRDVDWRILYGIDTDAIVIGEVFQKTTPRPPQAVITACKRRFRQYD